MFVYSFHAAAGPAHNAFSDNEIHDPDNKLVHQGEQTCVGVCKSFVRVHMCVRVFVCMCVCLHVVCPSVARTLLLSVLPPKAILPCFNFLEMSPHITVVG